MIAGLKSNAIDWNAFRKRVLSEVPGRRARRVSDRAFAAQSLGKATRLRPGSLCAVPDGLVITHLIDRFVSSPSTR